MKGTTGKNLLHPGLEIMEPHNEAQDAQTIKGTTSNQNEHEIATIKEMLFSRKFN